MMGRTTLILNSYKIEYVWNNLKYKMVLNRGKLMYT